MLKDYSGLGVYGLPSTSEDFLLNSSPNTGFSMPQNNFANNQPVNGMFNGMGNNQDLGASGGGFGNMLSDLGDWFKNSGMVGSTDGNGMKTEGWGGTALGLGNLFLNMSNYGQMKKASDAQMGLARTNLDNQVKTTRSAQEAHANRVYQDAKANGYAEQVDTPEVAMKKYGVTA